MNMMQRFTNKVKKTSSCWIWTGAKSSNGYGVFMIDGKAVGAHRAMYTFANGEIPRGLVIDHLCRNHACVNPEHLEAVTSRENTLRGVGLSAKNAKKTVCKRGHSLSGDNLRFEKSKYGVARVCRECKNILKRQYRAEGRMA